jgi:hypothetical protein
MDPIISLIATLLTLLVSFTIWSLSERSKRIESKLKIKEERYMKLISSIQGFGDGTLDVQRANEFPNELNLAWIYCSDDVIKKCIVFIDILSIKENRKQADVNSAIGDILLSIRKDLEIETKLKKEDVRNVFYNP